MLPSLSLLLSWTTKGKPVLRMEKQKERKSLGPEDMKPVVESPQRQPQSIPSSPEPACSYIHQEMGTITSPCGPTGMQR